MKQRSKTNGITYCKGSETPDYCIDEDGSAGSAFECPKGFKHGEKPKGVK
jgi:hypothetical protein